MYLRVDHHQMPSRVRWKQAHDALLVHWFNQNHGAALRHGIKVIKQSNPAVRTVPDPYLREANVRAIARQTAYFDDGGLKEFEDSQGVLQEIARLLELMLVVLGPVRVDVCCMHCG